MKSSRLVVGILGLATVTWWWSGGKTGANSRAKRGDNRAAVARPADVQASVLGDGFAVAHGTGASRRVLEVDRSGVKRRELAFAREGDVRIVGTTAGPTAVFEDDRRIRVVRVADNNEMAAFGDSVQLLCDGSATNDHRFAVGWLEANDTIWFVHGPTSSKAEATLAPTTAATLADKKTWCGIASAEQKIALFWRDRDRLFIQTCTKKKCEGLASSVAFPRNDLLTGFGCVKDACLLASRRDGKTTLMYVTGSGSVKWRKPIETDALSTTVIGAGDRAFAVGYAAPGGAEVIRLDRGGKLASVWKSTTPTVPALAWSQGQLLIGQASHTVIGFPR